MEPVNLPSWARQFIAQKRSFSQWAAIQTDHEVVPFLGVHRFKLSGMAAQALPHASIK
jgi:hypothetical protein